MGGSYSFEVTDSPTMPGHKSVVSTEISGVDAAKLLQGIEKYVRAGQTKHMASASCSVEDKAGGVLVSDKIQVPAIFGGGEHSIYNLYNFNAETSSVDIHFCPTEFMFKEFLDNKGLVATTSRIKVLSDPVRIEFWVDATEARASGPIMMRMLNEMLKFYSLPQTAKSDQKALGKDGKYSAVTDPIESGEVTPDNYFDKFREFLKEKSNVTELPDGTMVEERSGMFGDIGRAVSYAKHTINKEANHLYCYEYGDDENMQDLISVTHVQVHKEPAFVVEQWNEPVSQRLTDLKSRGEAQVKLIKDFVEGVLKFMEES